MRSKLTLFALLFLLPLHILLSQGTVYLVLGSDTGIWDGMDVARYHCDYSLTLFTDPARNATRVMDPGFRLPLKDSFGTPVKLTWWMMAGNIFRYAINTDVPNPNTMTLYLMKKYEGESIRTWGDELTLHYHTFVWTDYDGDGKYFWNQALSFAESSDDFDVTLTGFLLEENTFPVSFRSGWHAMDNGWQQRLDMLLPYSLHNDWPAQRVDMTEPLDNTYDWSRAPSTFIPFHPSPDDYQVPGSCRGWNVRSRYMSAADSAFMAGIFDLAAHGTDQVVCLWAHLPEEDFLDNVRKVDASAHKMAAPFPSVKFRYCTAVEAMQRWRKTADTTRPQISLTEIAEGGMDRWSIFSNEPLFQTAPFVAAKDRYGEYHVLPCHAVGDRVWETSVALPGADIAKVGVAATDTAGNLTTTFIRYLRDDIFVDNSDPGYAEELGSWSTTQTASWGTTARLSTPGATDSAKASWTASIDSSGLYSVYVQVPPISSAAQDVDFRVLQGSQVLFTQHFGSGVPSNRWVYLGTQSLTGGINCTVAMVARGGSQPGSQVAADVVKITAMVRDRWLVVPDFLDAGELVVGEESTRAYVLANEGIQPVVISAVTSTQGSVTLRSGLPLTIPPMGTAQVEVAISPSVVGPLTDTVVIHSDDPRHGVVRSPVRGSILEYFALVDDRDSLAYSEVGSWSFSNARAYGATSRYAYPALGVSATFSASIRKEGVYHIQEIVPTTVNASLRARYVLFVNDQQGDSAFVDQNAGSGTWVSTIEHFIPGGSIVVLELTDAMSPVVSGLVLRADAVRFQWVSDGSNDISAGKNDLPLATSLSQNYPNPFNPTTGIQFSIVNTQFTILKVYDILGREVTTLVNERKAPGYYAVRFDASGLASGIYLYRLTAGQFVQTRKMIILK